ncbi:MAG: PfkB family carbohydrate kinase [Phycisphaerales bacterium]|nr:PfkB family carbohydrate kinase [Phycisphaerales bacterium]
MPSDFQRKIVDHDRLLEVVREARAAGKTIVQCHGCFDIVHPGHIRYLEFARQQGDVLIVSLTGDLDVGKGDNRPYIPQEFRAENLAAIMFVDYVHINASPTAEQLLGEVRPDVYVKGREYEGSTDPGFLAEKNTVEGYGGRIIYSSGEIVFSSTELIGRMPRAGEAQAHRLKLLCRVHDISAASLEDLIHRFADLHVLIVGDVIVDRYVMCDALGLASEGPMISLAHRDERTYVGGAAIVARHVAALGAHAFLLSAAAGPKDAATQMVRDVLTAEGVESHLIDARPAVVEKTRFLAEDTKLFKLDRARRVPLDSVAERRAAVILEQQSKVADAVIFCDFGYGMITGTLLQRVLPTLRQNVRTLTADVSGGRAHLLSFRNVDLLCPTEREARAMLDDNDSGLATVAWEVLRETQARHIFITLEKRGMLVFERRSQDRNSPDWSSRLKSELLPAFADYAVDHLGCGDALLAASTLALAAGASLTQSAYLGNAAAAIEAGQLGNHPVDEKQLRDWLRARRELSPPTEKPPPLQRGDTGGSESEPLTAIAACA